MNSWQRMLTQARLRYSVFPVALFCFNAWLCFPLFRLDYSARMESAEASFISISTQMLSHWRDFSWWPLWYGGVPGVQTYPPLLHILTAAVAGISGISVAHTHHIVTACFYCLGPVSLYVFCLALTRSWPRAAWSAVAYSLISPTAFFIPWVRAEISGAFRPWRICTLVLNGDGPHIAALALVPFALAALHKFLRERKRWFFILTVLGFAAVACTNWIGTFTLAASVLIHLLAVTNRNPRSLSSWLWTIAAAMLAYCLASPWIPPSAIALIPGNSAWLGSDERATATHMPQRIALLLAAVCLFLLFAKWKRLSSTAQFVIAWSIVFAALPLSAEWLKTDIVIQPHRYQLEFDLTFCLLGVLFVSYVLDKFPHLKLAVFTLASAAVIMQAVTWKHFMTAIIQPTSIERTIEYRVALWLTNHIGDGRAYVTGSTAFWLDAFSNVPQMGGGADQALPNETLRTAFRTIYGHPAAPADPEGRLALLWLQAYGVDLAVVGGPHSQEYFKLFTNPEKFAKIGALVWQDGDDKIYQIPRRSRSLAHVIGAEDRVQHRPQPGDDIAEVRRYVVATENAKLSSADFHWRDRHRAFIDTVAQPDQLLSIQIEYHDGWRATVDGGMRPIHADGLGLTVIEPHCHGPCHVELQYDGGRETRLATVAFAASLTALLFVAIRRRRELL